MITITKNAVSATIDPLGAELITLKKDSQNLLWCRDPRVWGSSAPLLFPICGRLREGKYTHKGKEYFLSPHGFAQTEEFTVIEQSESKVTLELRDSEQTRAVYPFAFCLRAVYRLEEDGLHFAFEVENTGEETLYYSLGGHWGFALKESLDAYHLHFDSAVTLEREILDGAFLSGETQEVLTDSKDLPLGYHICDNDTYVFKNAPAACTLMHGDEAVVRLEYPNTRHLLLWTRPEQKYLCIEPWNGMPDGAESGKLCQKDSIEKLAPGAMERYPHRILF